MLLQVEVIPSDQNSLPSESEQSQTLFVNLKSAAFHHRNGTLLFIGRKESDITFKNAKALRTLSRSHCRLRLVSLSGKKLSKAEEENDKTEENEPLSPKTEQEEKTCLDAIDGLAIVLDDLGR